MATKVYADFDVSIHARTWRAIARNCRHRHRAVLFQSTPARGGRFRQLLLSPCLLSFQSTPARGGRFRGGLEFCVRQTVSIHARTWRAIADSASGYAATEVSIHARTWRAMISKRPWRRWPACFNPRPHVAGDDATPRTVAEVGRFNPRPHVAGDGDIIATAHAAGMFQSTPARGGRSAR